MGIIQVNSNFWKLLRAHCNLFLLLQLPLLIQELDSAIAKLAPGEESGDPEAWYSLALGLLVTGVFVGIHAANNPIVLNLYVVIASVINIPIAIRSLRRHIGVAPRSRPQRIFVITYDILTQKLFLSKYLFLFIFCVLVLLLYLTNAGTDVLTNFYFQGIFNNVEYCTLQLLDVVAISSVVGDIIKSVTQPGTALMLIFYLFVITVIISTSFGMSNFGPDMRVSQRMT